MGKLVWSLSEPELDIFVRAGLGGMALAIDSATQMDHDLGALKGEFTRETLTLEWPDSANDAEALTPLVDWAWQARGRNRSDEGLGVLYFPGIHRRTARDNVAERILEHNGVLGTFLQHPRSQPTTNVKELQLEVDESTVELKYKEPKGELKPRKAFRESLFSPKGKKNQEGELKAGEITFAQFIRPGATGRYIGEDSWGGSVMQAMPMLFAPTCCFYLRVGNEWVVVVPDIRDLDSFVRRRPEVALSTAGRWAASLEDAGLRVVTALRTQATVRRLERRQGRVEVIAMQVGSVGWNQRQRVRKGVARFAPSEKTIEAFSAVQSHLRNRVRTKKDGKGAFVAVSKARSTIVKNLAEQRCWYLNLFRVPTAMREQVDRERRKGESPERAWFRILGFEAEGLRGLMNDLENSKTGGTMPGDALFRSAFHQAIRNLYGREAAQETRGSRSAIERIEARREKIRRELQKVQTQQQCRAVLAELFAEAGGNPALQEHGDEIWNLIDDPSEWRRTRDLALLSLVTYRGKEFGQDEADEEQGETEQ